MAKLILQKIKDRVQKYSDSESCINGHRMTIDTQYKIVFEHFRLANIGFGVPHEFWDLGESIFDYWFETLQSNKDKSIPIDKSNLREKISEEMKSEPTDENMKVRINIEDLLDEKYTVIDLFCGCGGLSLGFEQAGYNVLLGIDNWEDALVTFRYNHHGSETMCADLMNLSPFDVEKKIGKQKVDLIIGGPPCQGFSIAGKRIIDDDRNKLYKSFVRMVAHFKPKAFVLENVPNILTIGDGIIKRAIITDFEALGYKVVNKVLLASDYGVPQNRRRAIFVGLLNGEEFVYPQPTITQRVTSEQALSDLPEYSLPDGSKYLSKPQSEYQKLIRTGSNGVYNHDITIHTEQTQRIIAMVPDGGNYKDLPEDLQQTRRVHIAWTRLNSKTPSITIDTGHRHHFHYKYNRIPTVRESARIQSFADTVIFLGSKTSQYKQVGNAVPPLMAQAIAEQLMKQL